MKKKLENGVLAVGLFLLFVFVAGDRYEARMDASRYSYREQQKIDESLAHGKNPDWFYPWIFAGGILLTAPAAIRKTVAKRRARV